MDTETKSTPRLRGLPDLHDPWRNTQHQHIRTQLNLDYWELDYSVLALYPRDQTAHRYICGGDWNRQELLAKHRQYLVRSSQKPIVENDERITSHTSLVFRFPEKSAIIILDESEIEVFAPNPETAWELGESLREEFQRPPKVSEPHFFILKRSRCEGIQSMQVKLTERDTLDEQMLELYYGEEISQWQEKLLEGITNRHCGISILQGPPGTGKTTFLRHLMMQHGEKLRCYFIPSSSFNVLKDTEFVGFWGDQRVAHRDKKLVVMLEDAEAILGTRAYDNRAEISNLLNITDGLLGDYLRLHLICTMNADLHDLDPAILRPGRLVARRHFGLIPRERALRLVQYLEKSAPSREQEEYSLAELFNDHEPVPDANSPRDKRILGFAQ